MGYNDSSIIAPSPESQHYEKQCKADGWKCVVTSCLPEQGSSPPLCHFCPCCASSRLARTNRLMQIGFLCDCSNLLTDTSTFCCVCLCVFAHLMTILDRLRCVHMWLVQGIAHSFVLCEGGVHVLNSNRAFPHLSFVINESLYQGHPNPCPFVARFKWIYQFI